MSLLAKYPYLEPLTASVRRATGSGSLSGLAGDERVLELGLARARSLAEGGVPSFQSSTDSLAAFLGEAVLAVKAGHQASARVVELEYMIARRMIVGGRESVDAALALVKAAGGRVERAGLKIPWAVDGSGRRVPKILIARIHVASFLRIAAPVAEREKGLSLSNSFLKEGYVYLDVERLRQLAAAAARKLVLDRLREAEAAANSIDGEVEVYAVRLKRLLEGAPPLRPDKLPHCIRFIAEKIRGGESVGEVELYTLITFLSKLEYSHRVLAETLGLDNIAARNLTKALAKISSYPTPKCSKLAELRVCECRGNLLSEYLNSLSG